MGNTKPVGIAYSDPELTTPTADSLTVTTLAATTATLTTATVTTLTVGGVSVNSAAMTPGAGFAGTGTIYKASVQKVGDIVLSRILIDLTGTASTTNDLDIIGTSGVSHIGQVTVAKNGTHVGGKMTCLEAPAGGVTDIDLYYATEATGAAAAGVAALVEIALITNGQAWTTGMTKGFLVDVAADKYLYLCGGTTGTAATYTGGKFLIELFGY